MLDGGAVRKDDSRQHKAQNLAFRGEGGGPAQAIAGCKPANHRKLNIGVAQPLLEFHEVEIVKTCLGQTYIAGYFPGDVCWSVTAHGP